MTLRRLVVALCALFSLIAPGTAAAANGTVTGTVTAATSHAALAGVNVIAFDTTYDDPTFLAATTVTDGSGNYTISLPQGEYKLQFSAASGYVRQFYSGKATPQTADGLAVKANTVTAGIDAALADGATISGTITDAQAHDGVRSVTVDALDAAGVSVASAATGSDGTYSLTGLPAGTYSVRFTPGYSSVYGQQSYAGKLTLSATQTRTGIDAQLIAQTLITGTVTSTSSGKPLSGIEAEVLDDQGKSLAYGYTRDDGTYAAGGLAPGSYHVHFGNDFFSGAVGAAPEYFNGKTTLAASDTVTTAVGQPGQANAALGAPGSIAGTVTEAGTHAPLADVEVDVYDLDGDWVGSDNTDAAGAYSVSGLGSAGYKVDFYSFDNLHVGQFYGGDATHGATVNATAGQVTSGIDGALALGGTISGLTLDAASGRPAVGVSAIAYDTQGNAAGYATSGSDGAYAIGGLPAGSYRVRFRGNHGGGYASQYYPGAIGRAASTPVSVTLGQTTPGINAQMEGGALIDGTITDAASHQAIAGARVDVLTSSATTFATVLSDANGHYAAGGLAAGTYTVRFSAGERNYAGQLSSTITLAADEARHNVDAALSIAGAATGHVTDATSHAGLSGVVITATDAQSQLRAATTSAADGAYSLGGLPAGDYTITFTPANGDSHLSATRSAHITGTATTSGVDAALGVGGRISGTLATASGVVSYAQLTLYDSTGSFVTSASTDSQGAFTTGLLAPGSYRLGYAASGYRSGFYNRATTLANATPVAVTAGQTAANINITADRGGVIAGTVTDPQLGAPVPNISVNAFDSTGAQVAYGYTDAAGRYSIGGLATGNYRLLFSSYGGQVGYVNQYYHGATTLSAATPVAVTNGQTTSGIDAQMARGSEIDGHVTVAGSGAPAAGASVLAYDSSGQFVTATSTQADGSYALTVSPGTYKVSFQATGLQSQYYNNKSSLASADPVTVTSGQHTTGIDAALIGGGTITGTITDASTHLPVAGVSVSAYAPGDQYGTGTTTDANGRYTISGLHAGSFYVTAYGFNYAQTTYPSMVSVTVGQTTSGIDIAIQPAGTIRGVLRDASGPVANVYVTAYNSAGNQSYSVPTDPSGAYSFSLPPGTYRIGFATFGSSAYLPSYWHDKSTLASADPISVVVGQTVDNVDATLKPGGTIRGRVTGSGGGLAGISVTVYDGTGSYFASASTASDGSYSVGGLRTGSYRVSFGATAGYQSEWYSGKDSLVNATPVAVTEGATTTGIDAALKPGGGIAGTVTDAVSHTPLSGMSVTAYTTAGSFLASATSEANGAYSLGGLGAGSYVVAFGSGSAYVLQYYNGAAAFANATPVTVTASGVTSGIDAALVLGAVIQGTVTDSAANPVSGASVRVSSTTAGGSQTVTTDASGHYAAKGLSTGGYTVLFTAPQGANLAPQYYDHKDASGGAATVQATTGQITSGIDATLHTGARVSGTVTDAASHTPLAGVQIFLTTDNGSFLKLTAADGSFTIDGLAAGTVGLYVHDSSGYHVGSTRFVTTALGQTTNGDTALDPAGAISGTATDKETGAPMSGVTVTVFRSGQYANSVATDAQGKYSIPELVPGTYQASFTAGTGFGTQFYNGVTTLAAATPITVTAGVTSSAINGELVAVPVSTSLPTISGVAKQGQTLTEAHATWTHNPTGYVYQWLRCNSSGTNCSTISGATSQTYALAAGDAGYTIAVREIASNAGGDGAPATSAVTAVVVPLAPVNTSPPTISGRPQQGATLNAFAGGWANAVDGYAYQWLRCDSGGASCQPISGATATSYVPVAADVGQTLAVRVTATNAGGSGVATSAAGAAVLPPIPVNTAPPSISGSATQGATLTEQHGTWSYEPTGYAYQWQRCDSAGANCTNLSGATSSQYVPVTADVGHKLVVLETAVNAGGNSSPVASAPTAVIAGAAPVNTSLPSISGTAKQGSTLTESHGGWTNEPTSYAYQWLRCDAGGVNCVVIAGATNQTYVLTSDDVGSRIKVRETASNATGASSPALSGASGLVAALAPVNTAPPTITGNAAQGATLTAQHGAWSSAPTGYAYQWLRCDSSGLSCAAIDGATGQTYSPVTADVGHKLAVQETASNSAGAGTPVSSAATAVVIASVPVNRVVPRINGTAQRGSTLTAVQGEWTNDPTSYAYQWYRCATGCAAISGATATSYQLTAADVDFAIVLTETASNQAGASNPAQSVATAVVASGVPVTTGPPSIDGSARQGATLTAVPGTWTNAPSSLAHQWLRCNSGGTGCDVIGGAVYDTYVPVGDDVGHTLVLRETASNNAGPSLPAVSAPTAVVTASAPVSLSAPKITGDARQGATLAVTHGGWTNQPSAYSERWLRCDDQGAGCAALTTAATYTLVAADVGHTLVVEETASNAGGDSSPARSAASPVVVLAAPANTAPPVVSGTPQAGLTLTGAAGSWSGAPTLVSEQWLRCDLAGTSCDPIRGATALGYTLTAADVGHRLVLSETARNAGGDGDAARSAPTAVVTAPPLHAAAGETVHVAAGAATTLDGSASTPAGAIEEAHWNFGDGTSADTLTAKHTYAQPGTYTARLTVTNSAGSDSATTTVIVAAAAQAVDVTVKDASGTLLSGASLAYQAPDGSAVRASTDASGVGRLQGLPDGDQTVFAHADGYQPAAASATVSGGVGHVTITLTPGAVATSELTSRPMTRSEIIGAGIDVNDPANNQVYSFSVKLVFNKVATRLCGFMNSDGRFVGDTGYADTCAPGGGSGGGGGGGGGSSIGGCSSYSCSGPGWAAVGTEVDGHPVIQWLVLGDQVSVLKQFFSVDMVVNNLSPDPFTLSHGKATLSLPDGLSLAPTASPQALSEDLGTIPGNGSGHATWIVRGDKAGFYYLSAAYHGQLEPFADPVDLQAASKDPLHVWGLEGLKLRVQADSGALKQGRPYHVRIGVTNAADTPFYNVGLGLDPDKHERLIYQPQERFNDTVTELAPGKTLYSHTYVLVPDADSVGELNPAASFAQFDGSKLAPSGVDAVDPPKLYDLKAPTDTYALVHLHWEPVPGAQGYEVYPVDDLDTPFADAPAEVDDAEFNVATRLPAGTTDAFLPAAADSHRYFAVSTILAGRPTLMHPVIVATPGTEQSVEAANPGGGGGAGGGGSSSVPQPPGEGPGYDNGKGAPTPAPNCAHFSQKIGPVTVLASCFTGGKGVWKATGRIRVSGLDLESSGTFTIDTVNLKISADAAVDAYAGSMLLFHGEWSWSLPQEKELAVPKGLKIKGLPVAGTLKIKPVATGIEIDANATLGSGDFSITGAIHLLLNGASGLQLKGFKLQMDSDLAIKGLVIKQASLEYKRDGSSDTWIGSVTIVLPGKGPEVNATLEIFDGVLNAVSASVDKLNKPIADGVFLQRLGLELRFKPNVFAKGSIGLSLGPQLGKYSLASIDGSLAMTFAIPFVIEASGTMKLVDQEVSSADVKAQIPGSVSFEGSMKREFLGVGMDATVGGTVTAHSFDAEGSVTLKEGPVSANGSALVSDKGVAACASASAFGFSANVGAAHRWNGDDSLFTDSCGFTRLKAAVAQASPTRTVSVAPKTRQINLIVQGTTAAPTVLLTQNGATATVAPETTGRFGSSAYVALDDAVHHVTYIAIPRPAAGNITVTAAPGTPAISGVSSTYLLPEPDVKAKLKSLGKRRYKLSWTSHKNAGQAIEFRDSAGKDGEKTILRTTKASGSKVFTAVSTPGNPGHTVRALVTQNGLLRQVVKGPKFKPARVVIGTPKVKITLRKRVATISWNKVAGATAYDVTATTDDGRKLYFRTKQRTLKVKDVTRISARVRGVDDMVHLGRFRAASAR